MTELWFVLLRALAVLEWRLSSIALLGLCFAVAFGLHAVWGALDANGRALLQNQKYLNMLARFPKVDRDPYSPLVRTERWFRWAIIVWVATGLDSLVAMAVVPTDAKGATSPTWNLVLQLFLLLLAATLSVRAWLLRMALDRQVHKILRMADQADEEEREVRFEDTNHRV